jgi:3-oxoacyl-(acyl-carrier-protein) synthase
MTQPVVTGAGIASPIGCSLQAFWERCKKGTPGIAPLDWALDFGCKSKVCGRVPEDELQQQLHALPDQVASLGHHDQLGLAAAVQAIEDASLVPEALVVGSATAGFQEAEEYFADSRPNFRPSVLHFDELASTIAQYTAITGPQRMLSDGCTSSADAIGYACWMIRAGHFDSALVVGVEASLTPSTLAAFEALGAVTAANNGRPAKASRPFAKGRDGFVLGEAGGAIVVERADRAQARGAMPYARFSGFGSVNNAIHMTSIEHDGKAIARSILEALVDTGESRRVQDQIAYINAHGSATRQNDQGEAAAYHTVFGQRTTRIPVNSTKALVGHSLGAAGIVEIIHMLLSIRYRTVTPAVNADPRDPALGLFLPAELLHPYPIPYALKTASGFGGIHSALIFQACEGGTR